jgi:hypothetical protein
MVKAMREKEEEFKNASYAERFRLASFGMGYAHLNGSKGTTWRHQGRWLRGVAAAEGA